MDHARVAVCVSACMLYLNGVSDNKFEQYQKYMWPISLLLLWLFATDAASGAIQYSQSCQCSIGELCVCVCVSCA